MSTPPMTGFTVDYEPKSLNDEITQHEVTDPGFKKALALIIERLRWTGLIEGRPYSGMRLFVGEGDSEADLPRTTVVYTISDDTLFLRKIAFSRNGLVRLLQGVPDVSDPPPLM